jgi:hypothetical protein
MKQRIKEDACIRLWKTFLQYTTNELNDLFQQLQQGRSYSQEASKVHCPVQMEALCPPTCIPPLDGHVKLNP